jgi:hypothetical protein
LNSRSGTVVVPSWKLHDVITPADGTVYELPLVTPVWRLVPGTLQSWSGVKSCPTVVDALAAEAKASKRTQARTREQTRAKADLLREYGTGTTSS